MICTECDRPGRARNLCTRHYSQRWNIANRPKKPHYVWNVVSITGVHERCRRAWGPAKLYPCIECGGQARDWAYDGTDPDELLSETTGTRREGLWYSRFPEFYMPMCSKCHRRRDGASRHAELLAFRRWQHANRGSKLGEIPTV